MAAIITGSASTYDSSSSTFSTSVTVPSDATLAVLLITGYLYNSTNWLYPGNFKLGGTTFNNVVDTDNTTDYGHVWIGYISNPSTGSQTFELNAGFTPTEGLICTIVYFKNVAESQIKASGINTNSGGSITGLSTDDNSITIGVVYRYNSSDDNMTDTGNGFTKLVGHLYNQAYQSVSYKANSSSFSYLNGSYSTCAAVVIEGSGSTALHRRALDGPFYGSLRGSVR